MQDGRRRLRQALYMPAVSAISCKPDLARKYRHLCTAEKPSKVAITAVMRKLFLLANTLISNDKTWAANAPRYAQTPQFRNANLNSSKEASSQQRKEPLTTWLLRTLHIAVSDKDLRETP